MLATRLPLIIATCLCIVIGTSTYLQLSPYIHSLLAQHGFIELPESLPATKTSTTQSALKPETKQRSYNIASFKLFGDVQAAVKKEPVLTEKLPETTLKLKLTGVLAGTDNLQASALIEGPDRQTRNYRVEEEVPGGAILKQVFSDRVVLERSGRFENLIFEETRSIGIETQTKEEEQVTHSPPPTHSAQKDLKNYSSQQTQQIKDRLSRLRSRLRNNGP